MEEYRAFSQLRQSSIDNEKIRKITQKIDDAEKCGTFLVGNMSSRELAYLSEKMSEPIFYIYPVDNSTVAVEIKAMGASRNSGEIAKALVNELYRNGVAEEPDIRDFDLIGNTATVIAVLLQKDSRLKRLFPVLVNDSLLNKPYHTESGELVQLSSEDFSSHKGGLLVEAQSQDIDIRQLDAITTRQCIKRGDIIQIDTSIATKRFKDSGFSYTYLQIYYLGNECKMRDNRSLQMARILMEHNGEAIKNMLLWQELQKCGVNISIGDKVDMLNRNNAKLSNGLSGGKSVANKAIREVVKSCREDCKNIALLDFVESMGINKGYRFNSHNF